MHLGKIPLLCLSLLNSVCAQNPADAASPLGVFDFDLRSPTPAEKIHSIDGIGFSGIAMFLNNDSDLKRLAAYVEAKPDLRLIAGLLVEDHEKALNREQVGRVIAALAERKATLWLIMKGSRENEASVVKRIQEVADLAAAKGVDVCLYPHDGEVHTYRTAEEAMVYLKMADRKNLSLSVHLCHELRAGNADRLDAVIAAVQPHISLVTISGAGRKVTPNNPDWSDTIKPLGEGDFDPKIFLRALKANGYASPVILHTFGLAKKPANHHSESFKAYQAMCAGLAEEPKTSP